MKPSKVLCQFAYDASLMISGGDGIAVSSVDDALADGVSSWCGRNDLVL